MQTGVKGRRRGEMRDKTKVTETETRETSRRKVGYGRQIDRQTDRQNVQER